MPKPRKPQNPSLAISVAAVAVVAGLAIAALTVHHNNAGNGSVAGPYGNNNSSAGNSASKYSTVNPATPGNASCTPGAINGCGCKKATISTAPPPLMPGG